MRSKAWSIGKAANSWTTPLSITGWKVGQTPNAPVAAAKFGAVEFTYSNSEDGTYTPTVPASVGTYWVRASVIDTDNYYQISATKSFSIINKNVLSINTSPQSYTYDKTSKKFEVKGTNLTDLTVEYLVGGAYTTAAPTNAGKYTVRMTRAGDADYEAFSALITDGLEITPLAVNITWSGTEKLVYTGNPITISASASNIKAGDTVTLTLSGETETNSGTYTASVIRVNNANYTIEGGTNLTKIWSIAKAANSWTIPLSITGWKAGNTPNTPVAAAKFGAAAFTYSDSVNGIYTSAVPTSAGTHWVRATVAGTDNYSELSSTVAFEITNEITKITVTLAQISGVFAPVANAVPVTTLADTEEYSLSIVWSPEVSFTFQYDTVYTATITVTPKDNYTLSGVAANFFTVPYSTATNAENSGVITAVFARTASKEDIPQTYYVYVPVSNGGKSSVNALATVTNGTATVTIDKSKLETVLNDANTKGIIEIDAGLNESVDTVTIRTTIIESISKAAQATNKAITGLDIVTDSGKVSFDKTVLAALAEQTNGSTVTIHVDEIAQSGLTAAQRTAITGDHADDLVIKVTVKSGGVVITDYNGGKITVTVPYTLKDGETAEGVCVWHLAADGTLTLMECSYDAETKTVRFVTDHLSEFIVGCDAAAGWVNPFVDVAENDWFYEDVAQAYVLKLMQGTSNTTFSPYTTTTRGMIVTILWRLENEPVVNYAMAFEDVQTEQYYTEAVRWAASEDIVNGYSATAFGPEDTITREQLAAILYRYEQYKGGGFVGSWYFLLDYSDTADVSDWADEAMHWCVMNGIIQGSDGRLMPKDGAARAQAAAMLIRFLNAVDK